MSNTSDPLILSVETATLGGSVCIARGIEVLAGATGDPALSHSNSLLSDIQTCLSRAGVSAGDIELFAAASGPGSFTGLRIGLATVKGLAATLDRPCLGIPTLHAVAHAAGPSEATVALLPAGRGEVFVQLLAVSESEVTELDEAAHLSPERAIARYDESRSVRWAGAGAQAFHTQIERAAGALGYAFATNVTHDGDVALPAWILAAEQHNLANNVAILAYHQFQRGHLEMAESLTAIYVRPSDAELKCK
jgi:tRNA threonylcarbamoyladenosine biosynthesis protein TsaB